MLFLQKFSKNKHLAILLHESELRDTEALDGVAFILAVTRDIAFCLFRILWRLFVVVNCISPNVLF